MKIVSVLRSVAAEPPRRIGIVSVELGSRFLRLRTTYREWPRGELRNLHWTALSGGEQLAAAGDRGGGSIHGDPPREYWQFDWIYHRPERDELTLIEPTTGWRLDLPLATTGEVKSFDIGLTTSQDRELYMETTARLSHTGVGVDTLPDSVDALAPVSTTVLGTNVEIYAVERWSGCDVFRGRTDPFPEDPEALRYRIWTIESDTGQRIGVQVGRSGGPSGHFLDVAVPHST